MSSSSIAQHRLRSQRLTGAGFRRITDAVAHLGAVQAQDYALAKWALGLRVPGTTDADVERAFADGTILRTHVLRPTWHFVTPADIRWLLALTAPRVHRLSASMYRKIGHDRDDVRRCRAALTRALGGRCLTRGELRTALRQAGVRTDGDMRMSYVLMHAELDGLVCSGPRRGKQFTYALLDERAPFEKAVDRRDALVELARRFFTSRGPATPHDFAKWSGLTLADARQGLEGAGRALASEVIDGRMFWVAARGAGQAPPRAATAHLLSIYDEYISGYKDRRDIIAASHAARLRAMGGALTAIVIVNGRVVGTWKRRLQKKTLVVDVSYFVPITKAERGAVTAAIDKFLTFCEPAA
ncbi:MAG TPA: winged helix DNA-binding domain-containing protein [Vicinamibacterales bacterium]|nr:winged helix DNA-binding domain-containing protein [Vicinamibacterales bacterium]